VPGLTVRWAVPRGETSPGVFLPRCSAARSTPYLKFKILDLTPNALSASAFVARVLREALLRERDALLAEEFRQAAVDPDFLAACEEVEREFEAADAETASLIR